MVTLSTDLDDGKTETPADKARLAVAKHCEQCLDDVYHALLGIIETESAKGAVRLSLFHYDNVNEPLVLCKGGHTRYINGVVCVTITVASLIATPKLLKRLIADGFAVTTIHNDKFGTVIDYISWE